MLLSCTVLCRCTIVVAIPASYIVIPYITISILCVKQSPVSFNVCDVTLRDAMSFEVRSNDLSSFQHATISLVQILSFRLRPCVSFGFSLYSLLGSQTSLLPLDGSYYDLPAVSLSSLATTSAHRIAHFLMFFPSQRHIGIAVWKMDFSDGLSTSIQSLFSRVTRTLHALVMAIGYIAMKG